MADKIAVREVRKKDAKVFLSLVDALADYERLPRPTPAARARLARDGFGSRKRFDAFLAWEGKRAVGYAIVFNTYSSFLALPTLYLEDIFILPEARKKGIGKKLFLHCIREAERRQCGRMEWVVLDWNAPAIRFYDRFGARHLKEWYTFRLERRQFKQILKAKA